MKEATGELNMTVVTVVAIAAVGAFFYFFIWPAIQTGLTMNTCKNICPNGEAYGVTDTGWCECCPNGSQDPGCIINPNDWGVDTGDNTTGYISLDNDGYIAIVK